MDSELRKNIRLRWFESLFELSHYNFQKKVWLEAGVESYLSDYTEAVCKYFDDLDLGNGLEKFVSEGFISNQEANIFFEFHNQLEEYVDQTKKKGLCDTEILEDIEWMNLTIYAKENWIKLKQVLNDKAEIDYVNMLENKFANVT